MAASDRREANRWDCRKGWLPAVLILLGLVAVVVAARRWDGWITPIRIAGDSMAPNLLGPHLRITCAHCLHPIAVTIARDQIETELAIETVCDACGQRTVATLDGSSSSRRSVHALPGRRVWLRRLSPTQSPERWQTVVIKPQATGTEHVKRLVGLPGESLEFDGGDLLSNGERVRKSLSQFKAIAIPVVNSHPGPAKQMASRHIEHWRAAWSCWQLNGGNAWRLIDGGHWRLMPDVAKHGRESCGMEYRGRELVGRQSGRWRLLDDYSFNDSLSRSLHPMRDVLFGIELADVRPQNLTWRMRTAGSAWQVDWDIVAARVTLRCDDQIVAHRTLRGPRHPRRVRCDLAYVDGQLIFAIDGLQVLLHRDRVARARARAHDLDRRGETGRDPAAPGLEQLTFEATRGLTVKSVRLDRDVHYLPPSQTMAPIQLGHDHHYVLGDNVPVSIDSRHHGPVPRDRIEAWVEIPARPSR
jgi:signal peptidase I